MDGARGARRPRTGRADGGFADARYGVRVRLGRLRRGRPPAAARHRLHGTRGPHRALRGHRPALTRGTGPLSFASSYSVAKLDSVKAEFSDWPCSLARTVDVFGDSWTLLIVRDALQGLARFDEFKRSLNVAGNTLSDRLGRLVDAGVMTKRFYQDNPPRYEYLLTEKGRDFFPVLTGMLAWGDRWLDVGAGAP